MLHNLLTHIEHPQQVQFSDLRNARVAPYVRQRDGSSCGPIAVLALFDEITGSPFLGLQQGSSYNPSWHIILVDWYVQAFQPFAAAGVLVRKIVGHAIPWTGLPANDEPLDPDTTPAAAIMKV